MSEHEPKRENVDEWARQYLLRIIEGLVNDAAGISINTIAGAESAILEIHIPRREFGRVIGSQGRTSKAIKEIMHSVSGATGRKFVVNMLEAD